VPLLFQLLIYPMLDDRTVTLAEPHPIYWRIYLDR
jgi:hypothetical protein